MPPFRYTMHRCSVYFLYTSPSPFLKDILFWYVMCIRVHRKYQALILCNWYERGAVGNGWVLQNKSICTCMATKHLQGNKERVCRRIVISFVVQFCWLIFIASTVSNVLRVKIIILNYFVFFKIVGNGKGIHLKQ